MRIIAGQHRGRPLVAPAGQATRPTSDRARETLFSMLTSRIGGFGELHVADLFAGSGALGLEALSRGAHRATFVDSDHAARRAIETNIDSLGYGERATVLSGSALALPAPARPFDVIFADPPYAPGSGNAVVEAVAKAGWLVPGGWLAIESDAKDKIDAPGPFTLAKDRKVGRARLSLLFFAP
ncbi:16S rRNA (guanine(966)-N(2))-methyltransferase RsmD [Sphingomicrobium aestuariivivum]|uniref:16S rRNA (guanine(966)-N(2))-methyltransferase RsmD n=1 Tax=Sphingomicrobium aestuariivivum TaxID=1582356 RepID=UPI001FD6BFAC|nr:16S rRNA (guanine(966)-N(2))-methyltransferase RsmD [Sphingomicrobium aestuariivivum]MCJ8190425.1 16S rRNA (guanine(966)-N(2))-methyltransferase RsmD [Sphingomicrobium aestuariivivum]